MTDQPQEAEGDANEPHPSTTEHDLQLSLAASRVAEAEQQLRELGARRYKHPNLASALAAFQANLPLIPKSQKAEVKNKQGERMYSYNYADLADVSVAALPFLGRVGLAFSNSTRVGDTGQFWLDYKLTHESGESEGGSWPLPNPATSDAQFVGGAISYARRYTLCLAIGIAPGDPEFEQRTASAPSDEPWEQQQYTEPAAPEVAKRPEGWQARIEAAKDQASLREIWVEARDAKWIDDEVSAAIVARQEAVVQPAESAPEGEANA